ncbi:MAG: hypothetical protein IJC18_00755, partial [Clostridia bacterium]|nr:hypothetical protein [Clostridia bacterium]
MMKRILALLLCGCILLPLAGCWDMREINDRVYVVGIGLDKSEKEGLYDFSFQVAVPIGSDKAMTTNDIDYTVTTVVTGSMAQAVRTLNKSVRDVNFEHLACIIIGESMMKEDFPSLLEYLYRWSVVRRQCVVVASDKPAKEMLSLEPDGGNMSLSLAQMMEQEDGSRNKSSTMTLLRLYQASSAMEGFSLYRIGVSQDGVISGYNIGGADTEESSSDAKSKGSVSIVVSGINVYDGGDFVGTLDSYEAEMSRLFYDGQSTGVITTDHVDGKRYMYQIESS